MKNKLYTILLEKPLKNKENAKSYRLEATERGFFIHYISGELAGREKTVQVDSEDYYKLKNNDIKINDIFIKYDVG